MLWVIAAVILFVGLTFVALLCALPSLASRVLEGEDERLFGEDEK